MLDTYDVSDTNLGKGQSTQIKEATMKKYTKTERTKGVAIKLYDGKAEIQPDLRKEAQILGRLDHPNIIRLFEVAKVGPQRSLVLELCTGGGLLDRLPFKESQASHIMRQLLSAVSYMHSKNIIHRDIDCSNIMFRSKDDDSDIRLIDFGSATELELVPGHPGAFKFLKEKTGSLHIMAPEVVRGRYGPKADVWSCGMVAYTILNGGRNPFQGKSVYVLGVWHKLFFSSILSLLIFLLLLCTDTNWNVKFCRVQLTIEVGSIPMTQKISSKQQQWSMPVFVYQQLLPSNIHGLRRLLLVGNSLANCSLAYTSSGWLRP